MFLLIPFQRLLKKHRNLNLLLHLVVEMAVRMEEEDAAEVVEEVDTEDQENLEAELEEKENLEEEEEEEVDSVDEEEVKEAEEEEEVLLPLPQIANADESNCERKQRTKSRRNRGSPVTRLV